MDNKKDLSERDICSMFIAPALARAGWDRLSQVREEVSFTKGRIIVRGKLVTRGKRKRADYVLYIKPNIPLALIEAKDNTHAVGGGMQQTLEYAITLEFPFVPHGPPYGGWSSCCSGISRVRTSVPLTACVCGRFGKSVPPAAGRCADWGWNADR